MDEQSIRARITLLEQEIKQRQELLQSYRIVLSDLSLASAALEEVQGRPLSEMGVVWGLEKRSTTELVEEVIPQLGAKFSVRDVSYVLHKQGFSVVNELISGVLSRLAKQRKLEVVAIGVGRRPSVYRLPEPENSAERAN